ncbi:MAG: flagellar motor switch protein FliN [Deltaproteobacteria bacterium]|nr:flagellar motor switch protein FliN [Deltaproteobacteria bacterium]
MNKDKNAGAASADVLGEKKPGRSDKERESAAEEKADSRYTFSDFNTGQGAEAPRNIEFILDIPLEITAVLGQTKMVINDLLQLGQGSVVELSKSAGATLEILANQRLIARGEVVVLNEKYGIRITEIVSPGERLERLK